jgi:hypothetical protein
MISQRRRREGRPLPFFFRVHQNYRETLGANSGIILHSMESNILSGIDGSHKVDFTSQRTKV